MQPTELRRPKLITRPTLPRFGFANKDFGTKTRGTQGYVDGAWGEGIKTLLRREHSFKETAADGEISHFQEKASRQKCYGCFV